MERSQAVADLLKDYRATLVAMHACRVPDGGNPREWNSLVNDMQRLQLRLRESESGRDAITELIDDECLTVRQWSATNALAWAAGRARAELEREVREEQNLTALAARVTLREFDAGRLDTTWQPKD
jgi:hypothetical protein